MRSGRRQPLHLLDDFRLPGGDRAAPIVGGSPGEFITGASSPCGLVVYGHYLYWANGGDYGSIGRADLAGPLDVQENFVPGEAASGRQDLNEPCGLAVGPSGIYWSNNGNGRGCRVSVG